MRILGVLMSATLIATAGCSSADAASAKLVPAPALDVPASAGIQTAVLAGGCF